MQLEYWFTISSRDTTSLVKTRPRKFEGHNKHNYKGVRNSIRETTVLVPLISQLLKGAGRKWSWRRWEILMTLLYSQNKDLRIWSLWKISTKELMKKTIIDMIMIKDLKIMPMIAISFTPSENKKKSFQYYITIECSYLYSLEIDICFYKKV